MANKILTVLGWALVAAMSMALGAAMVIATAAIV
jgi:hypothetical protein